MAAHTGAAARGELIADVLILPDLCLHPRCRRLPQGDGAALEGEDASPLLTPQTTSGGARSSGPGGGATPRLSRAPGRNSTAALVTAGRHALREALRTKAKRGDDGSGGEGGEAEQPAPQAKLGRLPKNVRLIEAMAQHRNAKSKPKGWLLVIVDAIYRDGACSRAMGLLEGGLRVWDCGGAARVRWGLRDRPACKLLPAALSCDCFRQPRPVLPVLRWSLCCARDSKAASTSSQLRRRGAAAQAGAL